MTITPNGESVARTSALIFGFAVKSEDDGPPAVLKFVGLLGRAFWQPFPVSLSSCRARRLTSGSPKTSEGIICKLNNSSLAAVGFAGVLYWMTPHKSECCLDHRACSTWVKKACRKEDFIYTLKKRTQFPSSAAGTH